MKMMIGELEAPECLLYNFSFSIDTTSGEGGSNRVDIILAKVAPCARLVLLLILLCQSTTSAQSRWHEGSRPGAMGGAFVAISNDVNALAFNPAGLVYVPKSWMAEFGLQSPFASGLPFQENLRNEGALTASSFGVVYNRLRKPNQTQPMLVLTSAELPQILQAPAETVTANAYSLGIAGSFFNSGLLNEFFLSASFSKGLFEKRKPASHMQHLAPVVAISVTAKLVGQQYEVDIAQNADVNSEEERVAIASFFAEYGRNRLGFGVDAGLLAELHPRLHAALQWTNILQPDLALQGSTRAPRSLRGGVALLCRERGQWLLACDFEHSPALQRNRLYLGAEGGVPKIAPEILRARMGVNHNWLAAGFMLAKPGMVELHYAFLWPAFFSEDRPAGFFQHRFSVAFAKAP